MSFFPEDVYNRYNLCIGTVTPFLVLKFGSDPKEWGELLGVSMSELRDGYGINTEYTVKQCIYADMRRSRWLNSMVCTIYHDPHKDSLRKRTITYALNLDTRGVLDSMRWSFTDLMSWVNKKNIPQIPIPSVSKKEFEENRRLHEQVVGFYKKELV